MRISGITLPDNKRLEIALTAIYGIGRSKAKKMCTDLGIDYGKKPKEVTADEEAKIREEIDKLVIEGDLKRDISANVKRLKDIVAYRGLRHAKRLPARGQRTKTNSRTVRGGARKTMGSGKKSSDKK